GGHTAEVLARRGYRTVEVLQFAEGSRQHGFLFFFQAEDGIRDGHVTGVQTCALPIFSQRPTSTRVVGSIRIPISSKSSRAAQTRSEECRVGKECRSRWSRYHEKKKTNDENMIRKER